VTSDRLDKAQIEDPPEIQSEILDSLAQPTETVTLTAEAWKGWRKAAGLHVDPETAEVCWDCVPVGDPYGLRPPSAADLDSVGPMYFARSSESSKWIEFNDLPEATRKALYKKHHSQLAFSVALDFFNFACRYIEQNLGPISDFCDDSWDFLSDDRWDFYMGIEAAYRAYLAHKTGRVEAHDEPTGDR
jgi:hypothetical protein